MTFLFQTKRFAAIVAPDRHFPHFSSCEFAMYLIKRAADGTL